MIILNHRGDTKFISRENSWKYIILRNKKFTSDILVFVQKRKKNDKIILKNKNWKYKNPIYFQKICCIINFNKFKLGQINIFKYIKIHLELRCQNSWERY